MWSPLYSLLAVGTSLQPLTPFTTVLIAPSFFTLYRVIKLNVHRHCVVAYFQEGENMEGKERLIPVVSGIGNFFLIFLANMALRYASINEQQLFLIFRGEAP